jgi:prepilin-type N-terminal cleavage/methylation domain-containing protein
MGAEKILIPKRVVHKGFTLIEILVVLSLIAILAAVFLLQVSPMLDKTNKTADAASLIILDSATDLYKNFSNGVSSGDVFDGFTTDLERLTALLEEGYIDKIPVPNVENSSFSWNITDQKWILAYAVTPGPATGGHVVTASEIDFGFQKTTNPKPYYDNTITEYTGSDQDIIIPNIIDGVRVDMIYQEVFKDKGLTSVVFEEGITRIHKGAFQNNDLTEIIFPDSITRIDFWAFKDNDITTVTIGDGVFLENRVFGDNNSFNEAYSASGAGTYILTGGAWVKQ